MRKFNCLRDESMGRSLARRLLDPRIDLSSLRRVERRRLRRARRWYRRRPHHEGARGTGGLAVDVDAGLGQHEDCTPTHGYEPTREAAMAAFAKSWRRE